MGSSDAEAAQIDAMCVLTQSRLVPRVPSQARGVVAACPRPTSIVVRVIFAQASVGRCHPVYRFATVRRCEHIVDIKAAFRKVVPYHTKLTDDETKVGHSVHDHRRLRERVWVAMC